jgi:cell division protein ZapB
MDTPDQSTLPEFDLKRLEERVEELISTVKQLQKENVSLRSKQEHLTVERAELIEKTELAKSRVEAMISRLKSMETSL